QEMFSLAPAVAVTDPRLRRRNTASDRPPCCRRSPPIEALRLTELALLPSAPEAERERSHQTHHQQPRTSRCRDARSNEPAPQRRRRRVEGVKRTTSVAPACRWHALSAAVRRPGMAAAERQDVLPACRRKRMPTARRRGRLAPVATGARRAV